MVREGLRSLTDRKRRGEPSSLARGGLRAIRFGLRIHRCERPVVVAFSRFAPPSNEVTKFANFNFLQPGFVRPAVERSGSLWPVVLRGKHVERVENGPFPQLSVVESVRSLVVGHGEHAPREATDSRETTRAATQSHENGHASLECAEQLFLWQTRGHRSQPVFRTERFPPAPLINIDRQAPSRFQVSRKGQKGPPRVGSVLQHAQTIDGVKATIWKGERIDVPLHDMQVGMRGKIRLTRFDGT